MPSSCPSSMPSSCPSSMPSSCPSSMPSSRPSSMPSSCPSSMPSSCPSSMPSSCPSSMPSSRPSSMPSNCPSSMPSSCPIGQPTDYPTKRSLGQPTDYPTMKPVVGLSGMRFLTQPHAIVQYQQDVMIAHPRPTQNTSSSSGFCDKVSYESCLSCPSLPGLTVYETVKQYSCVILPAPSSAPTSYAPSRSPTSYAPVRSPQITVTLIQVRLLFVLVYDRFHAVSLNWSTDTINLEYLMIKFSFSLICFLF